MKKKLLLLAALAVSLSVTATGCLDQFLNNETEVLAASNQAFAYSAASLGAVMEALEQDGQNDNSTALPDSAKDQVKDIQFYLKLLEGYLSGKPVKITTGPSQVEGFKLNITVVIENFNGGTTAYSLDYNEIAVKNLSEAERQFIAEAQKNAQQARQNDTAAPGRTDTGLNQNNDDIPNLPVYDEPENPVNDEPGNPVVEGDDSNDEAGQPANQSRKASVWLIRGILTIKIYNGEISASNEQAVTVVKQFKVAGIKRRTNNTFTIRLRAYLSNITYAEISFTANKGRIEISYLIFKDGKLIHKGVLIINLKDTTYRVRVYDGDKVRNYQFKTDAKDSQRQIIVTPDNENDRIIVRPERDQNGNNIYRFER